MTKIRSKIQFNPQRLEDTRKASGKKRSYRSIAEEIDVNERTIRKSCKDGLITPELLDKLARALNVDTAYLMGEFDLFYDQLNDEEIRREYKEIFLNPTHHPYSQHLPDEVDYDNLIASLLKMYSIHPDCYFDMTSAAKLVFRERLHSSIYRVLHSYFPDYPPLDYFHMIEMPKPTLYDILEMLADPEEEIG